ncbi:unnamed protein product, partial [Protopolystoma xenopodis]
MTSFAKACVDLSNNLRNLRFTKSSSSSGNSNSGSNTNSPDLSTHSDANKLTQQPDSGMGATGGSSVSHALGNHQNHHQHHHHHHHHHHHPQQAYTVLAQNEQPKALGALTPESVCVAASHPPIASPPSAGNRVATSGRACKSASLLPAHSAKSSRSVENGANVRHASPTGSASSATGRIQGTATGAPGHTSSSFSSSSIPNLFSAWGASRQLSFFPSRLPSPIMERKLFLPAGADATGTKKASQACLTQPVATVASSIGSPDNRTASTGSRSPAIASLLDVDAPASDEKTTLRCSVAVDVRSPSDAPLHSTHTRHTQPETPGLTKRKDYHLTTSSASAIGTTASTTASVRSSLSPRQPVVMPCTRQCATSSREDATAYSSSHSSSSNICMPPFSPTLAHRMAALAKSSGQIGFLSAATSQASLLHTGRGVFSGGSARLDSSRCAGASSSADVSPVLPHRGSTVAAIKQRLFNEGLKIDLATPSAPSSPRGGHLTTASASAGGHGFAGFGFGVRRQIVGMTSSHAAWLLVGQSQSSSPSPTPPLLLSAASSQLICQQPQPQQPPPLTLTSPSPLPSPLPLPPPPPPPPPRRTRYRDYVRRKSRTRARCVAELWQAESVLRRVLFHMDGSHLLTLCTVCRAWHDCILAAGFWDRVALVIDLKQVNRAVLNALTRLSEHRLASPPDRRQPTAGQPLHAQIPDANRPLLAAPVGLSWHQQLHSVGTATERGAVESTPPSCASEMTVQLVRLFQLAARRRLASLVLERLSDAYVNQLICALAAVAGSGSGSGSGSGRPDSNSTDSETRQEMPVPVPVAGGGGAPGDETSLSSVNIFPTGSLDTV